MTFKKFVGRKESELENIINPSADYSSSSLFGLKAMTTRQPAFIHAALSVMEQTIPLTSKAEIIYEAISQAYSDYLSSVDPVTYQYVSAHLHIELQRLLVQSNTENDSFTFEPQKFDSVDDLKVFLQKLLEVKHSKSEFLLTDTHLDKLYSVYKGLEV